MTIKITLPSCEINRRVGADRKRWTRRNQKRSRKNTEVTSKNEAHASSIHIHEEGADHQLEELLMMFNDMPKKLQDEFLLRIGARRVVEAA